jgi:hypothetical protein
VPGRTGNRQDFFGIEPLLPRLHLLQLQRGRFSRPLFGVGIMNGSKPGDPQQGSDQPAMGPVADTNVVRVPFGVRRPRRSRPARPERWATVVLPFQSGSDPTPPPQAA